MKNKFRLLTFFWFLQFFGQFAYSISESIDYSNEKSPPIHKIAQNSRHSVTKSQLSKENTPYLSLKSTKYQSQTNSIHASKFVMVVPPVTSELDNKNETNDITISRLRKVLVIATSKRPSRAPITIRNSLLTYGGGDSTNGVGAIVSPKVVLVFWGSQWNSVTGDPANAESILRNFYMDIGGSIWLSTTTQYCNGASFGASTCGPGTSKFFFFFNIYI